jgi:hypothetical protein
LAIFICEGATAAAAANRNDRSELTVTSRICRFLSFAARQTCTASAYQNRISFLFYLKQTFCRSTTAGLFTDNTRAIPARSTASPLPMSTATTTRDDEILNLTLAPNTAHDERGRPDRSELMHTEQTTVNRHIIDLVATRRHDRIERDATVSTTERP